MDVDPQSSCLLRRHVRQTVDVDSLGLKPLQCRLVNHDDDSIPESDLLCSTRQLHGSWHDDGVLANRYPETDQLLFGHVGDRVDVDSLILKASERGLWDLEESTVAEADLAGCPGSSGPLDRATRQASCHWVCSYDCLRSQANSQLLQLSVAQVVQGSDVRALAFESTQGPAIDFQ